VLTLRGPATRRAVALTFDDGPDAMTREYLDCLDAHDAKATFFVVGKFCRERAADLAELVRRGHEVAGHGHSHLAFPNLSNQEIERELTETMRLLPRSSPLVRPPFGTVSPRAVYVTHRFGYTTVLWSLDSDDCRTEDPREVIARVSPARVRPGEIVLLHEGQRWTLSALPEILRALKEAGYSLVTVSDLLRG
jgi:peptidoglycan/xylan/chitin deacetylase (PgdA/CDA1 family)